MKYTWADFFKEVQKKYPKAKPDKVIKLVANAYGNKTRESNYNMKRSSWSLIVLEAIHLKIGTTKRSTTNISQIIRNWIRTKDFKKFQRGYLMVYFIAMMSDWLQGPYVYALYAHYRFTRGEIAFLFIVGFGSSMVFGTFIGSLADRYGRRLNCLAFGILYGLSCLTKHYNNYNSILCLSHWHKTENTGPDQS